MVQNRYEIHSLVTKAKRKDEVIIETSYELQYN